MTVFEKSCGGVAVRENNGKDEYLLIFNKKGSADGHWGFPKGHVENDETEKETAIREIYEETGLKIEFIGNFREVTSYSPKEGVMKDAVYFLVRIVGGALTLQQSEVAKYAWLEEQDALKTVTNEGDRMILEKAIEYRKNHSK